MLHRFVLSCFPEKENAFLPALEGGVSCEVLMTERQIPIVERLIAEGGGQLPWLRYDACSTLAMLAGAVDPTLHAEIAGDDTLLDIDERARAIFDRMPHRHPRGSVPDWERQPEHLRDVFRGFARGDAPIPR